METKSRYVFGRHIGARGLTLIETAIVVLVIGATTMATMPVVHLWVRHNNMTTTKNQVSLVHQQLAAYFLQNGRLPCPANIATPIGGAGFGTEDCAGAIQNNAAPGSPAGPGKVLVGTIPTHTLGVPDSEMFDGWNDRMLYAVTKFYTCPSCTKTNPLPLTQDQAGIEVQDVTGNITTTIDGAKVPDAVYVVLSHGFNQAGAYSLGGVQGTACSQQGSREICTASDPCTATNNCASYTPGRQALFVNTLQTGDNAFTDTLEYAAGSGFFQWQRDPWGGCTGGTCGLPTGNELRTITCTNIFSSVILTCQGNPTACVNSVGAFVPMPLTPATSPCQIPPPPTDIAGCTPTCSPVYGVCGTENGQSFPVTSPPTSTPTTNVCLAGTPTPIVGGGPWTWSCLGSYGGFNASCRAFLQVLLVNGVCGPANGVAVSSAPSAGLCSAGTATAVAGSGPWTWSCDGSGGGINAHCNAPLLGGSPVNGVCSRRIGACTAGTPTAVTVTGPTNSGAECKLLTTGECCNHDYSGGGTCTDMDVSVFYDINNWTCLGSGGGTNANCQENGTTDHGPPAGCGSCPSGSSMTETQSNCTGEFIGTIRTDSFKCR